METSSFGRRPRKPTYQANDDKLQRAIMLKDVPFKATAAQLRSAFKGFEGVEVSYLATYFGGVKGTGFVVFKDKAAAEVARERLKKQPVSMGGRPLRPIRVEMWDFIELGIGDNYPHPVDANLLEGNISELSTSSPEDPKSIVPTDNEPAMFMHYTISEDHSGDKDSVIRSRLAALGAREDKSMASLALLGRTERLPSLAVLGRGK